MIDVAEAACGGDGADGKVCAAEAVSNLGDSSVDLTLWLWTKVEDYWTLWEHIREDIYIAFNNAGVEIPFPQITVHQGKDGEPIKMEHRAATPHEVTTEEEKLGTGN